MYRKPHINEIPSLSFNDHPRYRGCVGHWIMAEGGGLITQDVSGNNNHGTLTNGPTWETGQFGSAIDFDGANDIIEVSSDPTLEGFEAITISAWIYPKANPQQPGESRIISKSNGSGGDDYSLMWMENTGNNGIRVRITTASTVNMDFVGDNLAINQWYFFVGTYDGVNIRGYVGGVLKGSPASQTGTIQDSNTNLTFGSHDDAPTNRRFEGLMDEVRLYDRALNPAEILSLYKQPFLEFEEAAQAQRRKRFFLQAVAPTGHSGSLVNATRLHTKVGGGLAS